MKLVMQPDGSNLCGQACIATLCGITLDEACVLMRTRGLTKTIHMKRALHAMSIGHGDRRVRGLLSRTALLFFRSNSRNQCHWVVWHNGKYYDPVVGVRKRMPRHVAMNAKLMSHLKVYL